MATLNQILAEQAGLIGEAKPKLEAAQNTPPPTNAPMLSKEATVAELQARVGNLTAAREDAVQQINEQIDAYEREIEALKRIF